MPPTDFVLADSSHAKRREHARPAGFTTRAVCGVLIRDLNAVVVHALSLGVHPESTLVLGTDAGVRRLIGLLESDTGVVRASPGTGSASDGLQLTSVIDILDAVAEVTRSVSRVVSDDEVSTVHLRLVGPDEVAIHVRRHGKALILVYAGTSNECLPDLLSICVAVNRRHWGVRGQRVRHSWRDRLIAQESKAMVVRNDSTSLFDTRDRDIRTLVGHCWRVDVLHTYPGPARVEVGEVARLARQRRAYGDGEEDRSITQP